MKKYVSEITSKDKDFAKWYTDLCVKAELMSYGDVKGFIIYRPYGFSLWENIKNYLNNELKKTNHSNVYFPMLIPENLFQKEKDHVDGFNPEAAVVTSVGDNKLNERYIIRPTSETLFCTYFSKIIQSHRDLPKKYNQWCSVVRWEKTTRPFLRGKEFLWQEGHTVHENSIEAKREALDVLDIYKKMGENLLAIPFLTGLKTQKEKFAGALETYSLEALMPDGQALQSGTTHYFGQEFSKAFDITYTDKNNDVKFVHQTSWGVSSRLIGALIMVHGDDNGLVMPPNVAPIQIRIIQISNKPEVTQEVNNIYSDLKNEFRVDIDGSDKSPGWKFSEQEMKGIPLRIEIGPKDVENKTVNIVKRYNGEKIKTKISEIKREISNILEDIHLGMLKKAKKFVKENTKKCNNYDEFKMHIKSGGYIEMSIHPDAEEIIKKETTATARIIPFDQPKNFGICPVTNKKAEFKVLFARAY